MREYSDAFEAQWLEQTAGISDASALGVYLTDADTLRSDVRACKGEK